MKISIPKILTLLLSFLVLAIIATISASFYFSKKIKEANFQFSKSQDILYRSESVMGDVLEIQSISRGFAMTGNLENIIPFENNKKEIFRDLEELKSILNNNLEILGYFDSLQFYIKKRIEFSNTVINTRINKGLKEAMTLIATNQGIYYTSKVKDFFDKIAAIEKVEFEKHKSEYQKASLQLNTSYMWLMVALLAFSLFFVQKMMRLLKLQKRVDGEIEYNAILMRNIPDAVFAMDNNFFINSWNNAAEKMYGWKKSEVIGKHIEEVIFSENQKPLNELQNIESYLKDNWEGEQIHYRKNEEPFFTHFSASQLKNLSGETYGSLAIVRDISNKKNLEEALQNFNQNLKIEVEYKTAEIKNVFERITDAFVALDENWNYVYVNNKAAELLNRTKAELIGHKIWEAFPDGQGKSFQIACEEAMKTQEPLIEEEYYVEDDKWFENYFYPSENGLSIYFRDITDKKKAAEEIKSVSERLRLACTAGEIGIWDWNLITGDITWDENMLKLYNITPEDYKGVYDTWQKIAHADDLKKSEDGLKEALKDKDQYHNYFRIKWKDGQVRHIESLADILRDENGNAFRLIGVNRDITEQKNAEQTLKENENKYRSLIEAAADGIFVFNFSGQVMEVNPAASIITGYAVEELQNMHITDLFDKDEIERLPIDWENLKNDMPARTERTFTRKDGSQLYVGINSKKIDNTRFISIIRDSSLRKKSELELKNMNLQLRNLSMHLQEVREEERLEISREIHDELGGQLTVSIMNTDWLINNLKTENVDVNNRVADLKKLLQQTISTVRNISYKLRPSIIDDLGLVAAMEWQCKDIQKRKEIEILFTSSHNEVETSSEISICLFRILQESLTNIIRHTEATKVEVVLVKTETSLSFYVIDNGQGFDKEKKTDKKTLGIVGMNERVIALDGQFEISSVQGKGTEVKAVIPI